MITYPFSHSFVYSGDNKSYNVEIDYNKAIIKMGYSSEEELYEQMRFDLLFSSDNTEAMQLVVHRDLTTFAGKIQRSEETRRINIVGEEFKQYSTAFSQIRALVINSVFQNLITQNPEAQIFDPITGELKV